LHWHPSAKSVPVEFGSQGIAVQTPEYHGRVFAAEMVPLYPALHWQPAGTFSPIEFGAQGARLQVPEYHGAVDDGESVPE